MTKNVFGARGIAARNFIEDVIKRHFRVRNALAATGDKSLRLAEDAAGREAGRSCEFSDRCAPELKAGTR